MDITNPTLLKIKGLLFLLLGFIGAGMIVFLDASRVSTVIILSITIWSFCRFYYFAFYVLHHYADSSFQYSGLFDLVRYLWNPDVKNRESSNESMERKNKY